MGFIICKFIDDYVFNNMIGSEKVNKYVELPLIEPLYQTYHYQGMSTAVIGENPTIRNWCLNEIMNLTCSRKFLSGFTTPELTIADSFWSINPHLDKKWVHFEFTGKHVNSIIKTMLDKGCYVAYSGVDDYYIKGKSWYKERHFKHDGLICGYNQEDKTFCIYAYDSNWVYKKFWTPQKGFNDGRVYFAKSGVIGNVCAIKPKPNIIEISPSIMCEKISEYLDSNLEKYPFDGEGEVFGTVVHEYIAKYLDFLYSGKIPYEKMDRRVFRLIWEHKKAMLERLVALEEKLGIEHRYSEKYKPIVSETDTMRMLYASHSIKRRDSVLPIIRKKLLLIMELEKDILNDVVEMYQKFK